jgi:hypothetical protein
MRRWAGPPNPGLFDAFTRVSWKKEATGVPVDVTDLQL